MWRSVCCVLLLTSSVLGQLKCPEQCRCPFNDTYLTEVDCNNASLTQIPVTPLPETLMIDLSFNTITIIRKFDFAIGQWWKLDMMYLRGNGLKTIENSTFRYLPQLNTLLLDDNDLKTIPSDVFSTNTELVNISFNGNIHLELPDTGFILPYVEILSLERCGLTKIPLKFFQNMTQLRLIFLQGNQLSLFNPLLVSPLTELIQLDLRNNRFTSLPLDLVHLPEIVFIGFTGNPFKCTCSMADVYSMYQSRDFEEKLTCLDPKNTPFEEFFSSWCKWHPWWFIMGGVLAVLIVSAIAYVVLKDRVLTRSYPVCQIFSVLSEDTS